MMGRKEMRAEVIQTRKTMTGTDLGEWGSGQPEWLLAIKIKTIKTPILILKLLLRLL